MGPEESGVLLVVPLVIAVVVGIRLAIGALNHARIKEYIENKSGHVAEIEWAPFGPGWFGSQNDYIYSVRFQDSDDNEHLAHCKTSMFAGVYLTEVKIIGTKKHPQENISLEEENRRLKDEIRRLKGG